MKAKKILALVLAVLLGLGVISPLLYIMAEAAAPEQQNIQTEAVFKEARFPSASHDGSIMSSIRWKRPTELIFEVVRYNDTSTVNPEVSAFNGMGSFTLNRGKVAEDGNREQTVAEASKVTLMSSSAENHYKVYEIIIPVKYTGQGKSLSFSLAFNDNVILNCDSTIPIVEEEKEDDDDEDEKEPDPVTPYIIIENYTYGGDSVVAGNDFVLNLTLRNTSNDYSLQNIVMNVATQGVLSMGSSSNTFYIDNLYAGSTMNKQITINAGLNKVTDDKDANSVSIKFDFQYLDNKDRKSGSSSENITIPVTFPDRFELSNPEMGGDTVMQGEEWYIYIPMINKGRSSVNNIMAYVQCEGVKNDQRQYIGNLQAGSESGIDFSFSFDEPGPKEGRIVVTYEDTNMNPKELSVPFSVNVEEMFIPERPDFPMGGDMMPPPPEEVPEEKGPSKAPIVVTAIVVCLISAYITVLKAKAKRSIFDDEEI